MGTACMRIHICVYACKGVCTPKVGRPAYACTSNATVLWGMHVKVDSMHCPTTDYHQRGWRHNRHGLLHMPKCHNSTGGEAGLWLGDAIVACTSTLQHQHLPVNIGYHRKDCMGKVHACGSMSECLHTLHTLETQLTVSGVTIGVPTQTHTTC
jgi:hypothetical protein